METMTKDQFAKFIAGQILEISQHNFDVFYDIAKIVDLMYEQQTNAESPIKQEFHLMVRASGCDLVRPDDSCYDIYVNRSTKIFKIEFCFNAEYFSNESFVTFL